jgi:hypothetical protein
MWINSPLGRWEMKERTKRAPDQEQLGRWLREVEGAKKPQKSWRSIVLALGALLGQSLTKRPA